MAVGRVGVLGANLKFNRGLRQGSGLVDYLRTLGAGLEQLGAGRKTTVRVFPHDLALIRAAGPIKDGFFRGIEIGAQDIHPVEDGSFTRAPLSASDLAELGVSNVLIGHSETRAYFGVTDAAVAKKLEAALKARIFATVCIGEDILHKEAGETARMLGTQITHGVVEGLRKAGAEDTGTPAFDLAYEPVWAIAGFAKEMKKNPIKAENSDIVLAHENIRTVLSAGGYPKTAEAVQISYGGSAKPANAKELLGLEGVNGLLIGTAAWEADSFLQMIVAVEQIAGQRV